MKGRTATSSKAVVVIGVVSGIRHLAVMALQRVLRAIGAIVKFELGSAIRPALTGGPYDYSCGCADLFKKPVDLFLKIYMLQKIGVLPS